ncbi:MAG: tetratricopeptide repeat protein, partial [Cyclobacteriaceae bacterium]|nr:tetratricopeptide repeat protein [Cyclobacteriaceae bacterium]
MKQAFGIRFIYILILALFIPSPGHAQVEIEEDPVIQQQIYDFGKLAFTYFQTNINLDSAEFYYKKAIELAYSSSNYNVDFRVAINHTMLASLYRSIHNNAEALKHLNEAEKILNSTDPTDILFGTIYHNKGNIYRAQEDYYRTKEYYEYALDFLIKNGYQDHKDFAFIYSNYVELLLELGEHELAEEKFSMIDLNSLNVSPLVEFRIRTTNGSLYSQTGKYDLAVKQFEQAEKDLKYQPTLKEYPRDILNYYYDVIEFHMLYGDYDQALRKCDNANIFIEFLSPHATKSKIVYSTDISLRSAGIHYQQGNLVKSLWIVNNSIKELDTFIRNLSIESSTDFKTNELSTALPDLYVLRSRILFEQFNQSNKFEDLVKSYEAYQQAIETLNHMKLAMSDENSRLFATSRILEVYNEAIYIGKMLYDQTGEFKYLEQSFAFTETSKSFALYSEIKDVEAMQFSDLPEGIKQKEKRFMGEIQAYEELLYKEQIKSDPDSSNIAFYKETLFHLNDDYGDLRQEIEQNYE